MPPGDAPLGDPSDLEPVGRWPLSAASTAVLRVPRTTPGSVLRLALKELVLEGSWEIARVEVPRRVRRPAQAFMLRPGSRGVRLSVPLPALSQALAQCCPRGGGPLREVVLAAVKAQRTLERDLHQAVVEDLVARGLLRRERRWYGTKLVLTPSGTAWAYAAGARLERWRLALAAGGPQAEGVRLALLAAPSLVLLLAPGTLSVVDDLLRREDLEPGDSSGVVGPGPWPGLDGVDGLRGLVGAVDGGVEGGGVGSSGDGSSGGGSDFGGGGGGDGGGGGGGGGD